MHLVNELLLVEVLAHWLLASLVVGFFWLLSSPLLFPLLLNLQVLLVCKARVHIVLQLSATVVFKHIQVKLKNFVTFLPNLSVLDNLNDALHIGGS